MTQSPSKRPGGMSAGLCATCQHARRIESARGSRFVLCARSIDDARFAKYPRLPVVRCAGYTETAASGQRADGTPDD